LTAGVVVAALATTSGVVAEEPPIDTRPLMIRTLPVAAEAIPSRFVIESAMLVTRPVPDDGRLAAVVTDPSRLVGRVTAVAIERGEAFTLDLLVDPGTPSGSSLVDPSDIQPMRDEQGGFTAQP
jgi:Flp pilus assembly protein CpaB